MKIKTILLDIGGVLVDLTGVKRLLNLIGNKLTRAEIDKRWADSENIKLYETGKLTTNEFANGFVKEFNIDITPEDFIAEFPLYAKGFFPGVIELLQKLKQNYTLACLSNTNPVQWNSLCERISIDKYFHHIFLSYEMGILKPDIETYTFVIEKLNCNPDEIVFFDDNEANVQACIDSGMNAYRVSGFDNLKSNLEILNLI
ncbi:MAG: HAD family phosphatase [Oscillospiraceae bacterium]|nr:HAD family phosphatase [Oscillospiraceae bacterium]